MTDKPEDQPQQTAAGEKTRQVALQKIYIRDASMEVPQAPEIFTQEWKPNIDVELDTKARKVNDTTHEVSVTITMKAKLGEEIAYLAEVEQAGLFAMNGFANDAEFHAVLGAYCPNILFPFVREAVADLVQRSGFPPYLLQPINFEAVYQQRLAAQQQGESPEQTKH